jgi:hypothetical protein
MDITLMNSEIKRFYLNLEKTKSHKSIYRLQIRIIEWKTKNFQSGSLNPKSRILIRTLPLKYRFKKEINLAK